MVYYALRKEIFENKIKMNEDDFAKHFNVIKDG